MCSFAAGALCSLAFAEATVPPARFTDPDRQAKLESAFPELEKVAAHWADERGVPGLAWGVVIDSELLDSWIAGAIARLKPLLLTTSSSTNHSTGGERP